jgi:hypothetical protein
MGLFNIFGTKQVEANKNIGNTNKPSNIPPSSGRRSAPTLESTFSNAKTNTTFITPKFVYDIIPIIRKLSWVNGDMGLALNDMVQLTNTGHWVKFDPSIDKAKRVKMKKHLSTVSKNWSVGVNGVDGLIDKIISQVLVSGALSTEWVVNPKKTGLVGCVLVNPETVYFAWNKSLHRFEPYQKQNFKTGGIIGEKMVKMNLLTFKYFTINGDTENPYPIPPFLTALNAIDIQGNMDKNISFIMEQLGLLGFFETKIQKPSQKDGENDEKYLARLSHYLDETKQQIKEGVKDGNIVGFIDDHEFDFHNTAKNLGGASDLYKQNEIKVAGGLKIAPEFLGFPTGSSESGMGIIFTKMLSQLVSIQNLIKTNFEFGYQLELALSGFGNVDLEVVFKPSTITDELKLQQAQEYKIRNIENKYNMGIISQQQKAEELGYDSPDKAEPRAPISDSKDKQGREADKDKSDRKTRDKNKPVQKRKDTNTKPV